MADTNTVTQVSSNQIKSDFKLNLFIITTGWRRSQRTTRAGIFTSG